MDSYGSVKGSGHQGFNSSVGAIGRLYTEIEIEADGRLQLGNVQVPCLCQPYLRQARRGN